MQFVDAIIQPVISMGYGLAAQFLGRVFNHYRPQSSSTVIQNVNLIEQLNFDFDVDPAFSHKKPAVFGPQIYYGLFDPTNTQIGDYFSDEGDHVFFCTNIEPLKPVEMIRCNRIISVLRPAANAGISNGYGTNSSPITLLSGWNCSIISGGIGGKNEANTPGSVKDHGVICYLPYYVPINTYDVVIDDTGRRYVIGENELTELGYRLLMSYESP